MSLNCLVDGAFKKFDRPCCVHYALLKWRGLRYTNLFIVDVTWIIMDINLVLQHWSYQYYEPHISTCKVMISTNAHETNT
jgi:hypothetical protein